jgi:hypothetical protein
MDDLDLDGIMDTFDSRGVTSLIMEMKNLDDKNVFPIFNKENYWNHVRGDLKNGNFGPDSKVKDFVPYIFTEKDDAGNYITHPIDTEEEFQ